MQIENNGTISTDSQDSSTLLVLIKKRLDDITDDNEFLKFKKSIISTLDGVKEYVECVSFTDKAALVHRHQNK
jgi:hypothetical protein